MQICSLEKHGIPVWSVSPLTKNLLVCLKFIFNYQSGYWYLDR